MKIMQQGDRVVLELRKMIHKGELSPGKRVAEIPMSKKLGVSRTPVRLAFKILEKEGLLISAGSRGYEVRRLDQKTIQDGIEVRGVLEGLAARLVAEKGLSRQVRKSLNSCLQEGDAIFAKKDLLDENDAEKYSKMNERFHSIIIQAADNKSIENSLNLNNHLPFAGAGALVFDNTTPRNEYQRLYYAHLQHHIIFSAIDAGEGTRAEAVTWEHAKQGIQYLDLFLKEDSPHPSYKLITAFKPSFLPESQ
ncbi:MAG: GntR family transcriptional regulator [SAR324 cluster bacterium]|nr:GntR family transcriptional regulator [SAR324 cluster bacterium]